MWWWSRFKPEVVKHSTVKLLGKLFYFLAFKCLPMLLTVMNEILRITMHQNTKVLIVICCCFTELFST